MTPGEQPAAVVERARSRRAGMIDFRPIFFVIGYMLLLLAAAMIVPALVDASAHHPDWQGFLASAAITAFVGGALVLTNRVERPKLNRAPGLPADDLGLDRDVGVRRPAVPVLEFPSQLSPTRSSRPCRA